MVAIDIYKADMSVQLTQNQLCTSYETSKTYTISTDDIANNPLTIEVNENKGFSGQIKFAGQTYALSSEAASNSGTSCYRLYNDDSVFIDCKIPNSTSMISKTFPVNKDIDCLTSKSDKFTFSIANSPLQEYDNLKTASDQAHNDTLPAKRLSPRQCTSSATTDMSGNCGPDHWAGLFAEVAKHQ